MLWLTLGKVIRQAMFMWGKATCTTINNNI